jgi:pimeloyl-ACP methyl ester carboxylesterase
MQRLAGASRAMAMLLLIAACSRPDESAPPTSEHESVRMVPVAPDVRLEVVDWGGSGPPMVFLVGMGMEAANYEQFASRFRDGHHIYGINRRGTGRSSTPASGYDAATRARDIIVVLDSLHVDKAVLVGHSFAADELSKVGVTYPSRVRGLVYLDAYNYPAPGDVKMPPLPPQAAMNRPRKRTREDSLQIAAFEALDTDTTSRPPIVNSDSLARAGAEPADYTRLTVPALAIYADQPMSAAEMFKDYEQFDARNQAMARRFTEAGEQGLRDIRERFRTQVRRGTVLVIPGATHMIYRSNADDVERAMRAFLASL